MSTKDKKVALVAGAAGVNGRNLILYLSKLPEWDIIGISRRAPDYQSRQQHVSVDLLNKAETEEKLKGFTNITHIFFLAYQAKDSNAAQIPPNLGMLQNLVEVVEKHSPKLVHVNLMEGTKWYGAHLGPFKTPAKEDDPRVMPPNFYYSQEDYLIEKVSKGAKWTWTGWRPNPIIGFATGNPMNILTVIAVYGALCKEMNIPFRFPGTEVAFKSLLEVVDVDILCKAMIWAANEPKAANQAFNISNGDVFRWKTIWPSLAKFFGAASDAVGPIMQINLSDLMADKKQLWQEMQKKYSLKPIDYEELVLWGFGDWIFSRGWDWFADVNKLRRFGFNEMVVDTEEMFLNYLKQLRADKIIP